MDVTQALAESTHCADVFLPVHSRCVYTMQTVVQPVVKPAGRNVLNIYIINKQGREFRRVLYSI